MMMTIMSFPLAAEVEATTEGECQTPLHYAACNDATNALRTLVKKGASLHPRDYKGRTPLQAAAELGKYLHSCRIVKNPYFYLVNK